MYLSIRPRIIKASDDELSAPESDSAKSAVRGFGNVLPGLHPNPPSPTNFPISKDFIHAAAHIRDEDAPSVSMLAAMAGNDFQNIGDSDGSDHISADDVFDVPGDEERAGAIRQRDQSFNRVFGGQTERAQDCDTVDELRDACRGRNSTIYQQKITIQNLDMAYRGALATLKTERSRAIREIQAMQDKIDTLDACINQMFKLMKESVVVNGVVVDQGNGENITGWENVYRLLEKVGNSRTCDAFNRFVPPQEEILPAEEDTEENEEDLEGQEPDINVDMIDAYL